MTEFKDEIQELFEGWVYDMTEPPTFAMPGARVTGLLELVASFPEACEFEGFGDDES